MPEAVIHVRPVCHPCGRIPAQLEGRRLSRAKAEIPIHYGFIEGLLNTDAGNTPLSDMKTIHAMMSLGESSPVPLIVQTAQLPRLALAPFRLAGERFISDLLCHCKWAIFLPHLSREEQWEDGFWIGMAGAALRRLEDIFWAGAQHKFPLNQTIFLNSQDAQGNNIEAQDFAWTMARLLGEMMIGPLLIAKGLPVQALGEDARKVFSAKYQINVLKGLVGYLEREYGDSFRSSDDYSLFGKKLEALHAQTRAPLPAPEADVVEQLLAA